MAAPRRHRRRGAHGGARAQPAAGAPRRPTTARDRPLITTPTLADAQVRLLRLFRMMQIRSFFQNWDSAGINAFKHPVLQRLLKQFVIMITSSHLIACGVYCIAWAQAGTSLTPLLPCAPSP